VRHVRVKENTGLAELAATAPWLAHETGEVCTEEHAAAAGAILVRPFATLMLCTATTALLQ